MPRITAEIGDIFLVIDGDKKIYFQLIAIDDLQLGSDVIRGFKTKYDLNENVSMSQVVSDEVDFYLHTDVRTGVKYKLWSKVGTIRELGELDNIGFRNTEDAAQIPGKGRVEKSYQWYVWTLGDSDFTEVGELTEEFKKYEIGVVFTVFDISDRMTIGHMDLSYYPD